MKILATTFFVVVVLVAALGVSAGQQHRGHHHHHDHDHKHGDLPSHRCIHDSEVIPFMESEIITLPVQHGGGAAAIQPRSRQALAQAFNASLAAPLRITWSGLDLYNESRYCHTVGQFAPTFKPAPAVTELNCTDDLELFTAQKRSDLVNVYLPTAFAKMSEVLNVIRLTEPIVGITHDFVPRYTKPQSWVDQGIPNTDFAFLVSAGITVENNIAFASTLASSTDGADPDNLGRPLVGALNIGPRYIPANTPDNQHNIDKFLATIMHEVTHALGFSWSALSNNFNKPGAPAVLSQATNTRGGLQITEMVSPTVVEAARIFFDCPTWSGMEMESFGGDGTAGSHWSRRSAYESYMTGVQGEINRIDNLTLAAFADMGYYVPNWRAAEPMWYGNKTGCPFLSQKCNSSLLSARADQHFCVKRDWRKQATPMCNYNLRGIGKCSVALLSGTLEPYFQYYADSSSMGGSTPLMQYCSFVDMFSNQRCFLGDINTGDPSSKLLGHTFGPGGRCVEAPSLISSGFQAPDPNQVPARCVTIKCQTQKTPLGRRWQVFLKVRASAWIPCPDNGAVGNVAAPSGFSGSLTCPAASEVCLVGARGHGPDILIEELPEILPTTLTTYFFDSNGSTYTLAPTTAAPPPTTAAPVTAAPPPPSTQRQFTMGFASAATCQTVVSPQATNGTWIQRMKNSLAADLDKTLGASGVVIKSLAVDGNGCLVVTADMPNAAAAAQFDTKITASSSAAGGTTTTAAGGGGANTVQTLFPTASSVMLENAPSSVSPAMLSLSVAAAPAPNGGGGSGGTTTAAGGGLFNVTTTSGAPNPAPAAAENPMCFISAAPCWVSYVVMSVSVALITAVIKKVVCGGKKDDESKNNDNDQRGGHLNDYEMHHMQQQPRARPGFHEL